VREFLDSLDESPVPYISQSTVVSITKQDVQNAMFRPLYFPMNMFPPLATVLSEAMAGNFSQLYAGLHTPQPDDSCPLRIPSTYTWNHDAMKAISCGDGESQSNLTVPGFIDHVGRLKSDSPDFGVPWSRLRLQCKGWPFRPKYRFTGPWETPEADPNIVEGKPAAPLMFISSTIDPVTPLANAHEASKSHPGSRVLVQNNVGHGSILVPGKCRDAFVKKYFASGELPPEDTLCEADCTPFKPCSQAGLSAFGVSESLEAWRERPPLGIF
jgi:pimeloyl-ACP methyl ester carboxylesterase